MADPAIIKVAGIGLAFVMYMLWKVLFSKEDQAPSGEQKGENVFAKAYSYNKNRAIQSGQNPYIIKIARSAKKGAVLSEAKKILERFGVLDFDKDLTLREKHQKIIHEGEYYYLIVYNTEFVNFKLALKLRAAYKANSEKDAYALCKETEENAQLRTKVKKVFRNSRIYLSDCFEGVKFMKDIKSMGLVIVSFVLGFLLSQILSSSVFETYNHCLLKAMDGQEGHMFSVAVDYCDERHGTVYGKKK